MPPTNTYHPYRRVIFIVIGSIAGVVLLSLLIMLLQRIFYHNPYGNEIRIDNFTTYYDHVPTERREVIFYSLYNAAARNTSDPATIPDSGALIRADTVVSETNPDTEVNFGSFIVDIAALEQSYRVQFQWSEDLDNPNLAGDSVLITCPSQEYMIYPNFSCTDSLIEQDQTVEHLNTEYPLMAHLPINIDYFINGNGRQIRYDIEGNLNTYADGTSSFKVIITDYTGGNYDAALERIRALGFNPDDYEIEYRDYSQELNSYPY